MPERAVKLGEDGKPIRSFSSNIVPARVGRPTNYRPELCAEAIEMGRNGYGRAEIAVGLGAGTRQTLIDWERNNPDFLEAMKIAQEASLTWWSNQGRDGIWSGSQFNANAYSLQVRNRFPKDYRDKQEHEVSGPGGRPIATVNITMTAQEASESYANIVGEQAKLASPEDSDE